MQPIRQRAWGIPGGVLGGWAVLFTVGVAHADDLKQVDPVSQNDLLKRGIDLVTQGNFEDATEAIKQIHSGGRLVEQVRGWLDEYEAKQVARREMDRADFEKYVGYAKARVERKGNNVEIWMLAVRSYFAPDVIRLNKGDNVTLHVTNIEQTRDELHGFAIDDYDVNLVIDPGETKSVTFTAKKSGVYAFYCTNFCSALHQEMQGYLAVSP